MRGREFRLIAERLRLALRLGPALCLGLLLALAAGKFQRLVDSVDPGQDIAERKAGPWSALLVQGSSVPLAKGKLLVASRDLVDPNFVQTVILLVEYNEEGAMGLVINRETDFKLSELLPDIRSLRKRNDTVFVGGPVAKNSLLLLVRSKGAIDGAQHVFGDVYASASSDLLGRLALNKSPGYRAYVGYAGWSPGQLEREFETGSWHVIAAQSGIVFDPDPAKVWQRLIRRTSLQFARARRGLAPG